MGIIVPISQGGPPSGIAGGDLGGNYPDPHVSQITDPLTSSTVDVLRLAGSAVDSGLGITNDQAGGNSWLLSTGGNASAYGLPGALVFGNATTGTIPLIIGPGDQVGVNGTVPVGKAAAIAYPTDLPSCITAVTAIINAIKAIGITN